MSRKVGIMLGNGFTIDLITSLNKLDVIEPSDLFRFGDVVKWPATSQPGFLSARYCPNLWQIGAKPGLKKTKSYEVIEELITVINLYATLPSETIKTKSQTSDNNKLTLYINAYQELISYLRELFIYYNGKISYKDLNDLDWGWKDYFLYLDRDPEVEVVEIVTYNYDIFLERLLDVCNIRYSMPGIKEGEGKFKIYKPHGSIGFIYEGFMEKGNYNIPTDLSLKNGELKKFSVRQDNLSLYMPMIPLIPPAGEAHRYAQNWVSDINDLLNSALKLFKEKDDYIICGISYWHVDRAEIDEILRNLKCTVNMRMINPGSVESLSAILSMVFNSYVHHSSASILKELI